MKLLKLFRRLFISDDSIVFEDEDLSERKEPSEEFLTQMDVIHEMRKVRHELKSQNFIDSEVISKCALHIDHNKTNGEDKRPGQVFVDGNWIDERRKEAR